MQSTKARRVYDTPDKGILWGWEVSAYVLTKAISAGIFLVMAVGILLGKGTTNEMLMTGGVVSLVFLAATGLLLIKDLDRPDRFLYVLLRPHWESWLVKGGYAITVFGGMVTAWVAGIFFEWHMVARIGFWGGIVSGILVAVYTAFLFAQAKGRDFWQSPSLVLHMLVHSFMAGAASIILLSLFMEVPDSWLAMSQVILIGAIVLNLLVMVVEINITHPTEDAKRTVEMIVNGRYASRFWGGVVLLTNILPLVFLIWGLPILVLPASILIVLGIYLTEKIWVEAPQRIPLT